MSSSTLPLYYKPRGVGTAAVPPVPGRRSTMIIFVVVVVFIIGELALITYNYSYDSTGTVSIQKYSRKSEKEHRIPHAILSSGPSEKASIVENHESTSPDNGVDTRPHPIDKIHEENQSQTSSISQKSEFKIKNSKEGVTSDTEQGILTTTQKRQAKVKEV